MPSTKTPTTPKTPRLQISATQLIASALAAVTATIAASYLGVSGTVIGAAIASVVTVTGNAVYGHSLHRTSERVRTVVPTSARWLPPSKHDADDVAPAETPKPTSPLVRRLAIASVAVFAAVLAVVTSVELVAGRPLSDLLRGQSGQGTTVFGTSNQANNTPTPPTQPAPTVTQTVIPKVVVTTPTVTQTAPPVTKTTTPTVTPSTPPPAATTAPTTPPSTPLTSPAPPTA
ncbi:MAG: hypothetical protein QOG22_1503 [Pseudonocardiales bacterium]|jgi:hypothetical protein|nr:hypothetical protein [Pseudonocardiales bacterium]MDT4909266.1 hypothetical protein [Pseudonocardiales bacterium]MDT4971360.1 hypothetical protein [Pseudonocardiales bacterium]